MTKNNQKDRIYFFDNVKAVLIILVVTGHLLEFFIDSNDIFKWSYILIYSFHMPLFAFVSGFLSKDNDLKKGTPNLIFQFIVFEIAYVVLTGLIFHVNPDLMNETLSFINVSGVYHAIITIFTPYWIMWYIISLLSWRILLMFFQKSRMLIVLAFAVAILSGYVDIYGRVFSFQRTFALFPFFLIGYFIKYDKIVAFTSFKWSKLLAIPFLASLPISYYFIDKINHNIFYFSDSYHDLGFNNWQGALARAIVYLISILMGMSFIMVISHKKRPYTIIGLRSLNIYILHGFIIKILWMFNFFDITKRIAILYLFVVLICLTMAIVSALSTDTVDRFMRKIRIPNKKKLI